MNNFMTQNQKVRKSTFPAICLLIMVIMETAFSNTLLQVHSLSINRIVFLFELIVFFIFLILNKYEEKGLIYVISLVLFFLCSYLVLKSTFLFKIFMVAMAVNKIGTSKSFEIIFKLKLFMLLFVIMLSIVGIIPNSLVQVEKGVGTVYGYCLGFTHPNRLASAICYLILSYVCWKNKKIKIEHILIIDAMTLLAFYITKSRTLFYCILLLNLFYIFRKIEFTRKITTFFLKIAAIISIPLNILISVLVPYLLTSSTGILQKIVYDINLLFSRRFTHIEHMFITYPVTLTGGQFDVELMNERFGYSVIDNGYIRFLYYFGIIGLAIFCILSVISVSKIIKNKEYMWATVFVIAAIEGLLENIYIDFGLNILVIFFAQAISIRRKRENNDTQKNSLHMARQK